MGCDWSELAIGPGQASADSQVRPARVSFPVHTTELSVYGIEIAGSLVMSTTPSECSGKLIASHH